uniref:Teneurin-a (Trinotate prediction) n=1 Tax=Henneguya salminicola TaxID=69463 RepID=A0A6G3MH86_HENSL
MDSTTNNCLKICNPGWSGINCETVSCDKISFCQNNGTCQIKNHTRNCKCNPFYIGEYCQFRCEKDCRNGICSIQNGAVRCVCYKGYFGRFCDHPRLKEQQIYYANIGFYITIIFLTFAWVGISVLIYVIFINNIKTESYEQNLEYDIIVAKKCAGMNIGYHNNLRFYPNDSLDETYENGENSAYSETINNSSINEIVTCESSVKEIESVILEYYQVETIPMDATNYMTADNIFLKNKNKLLCIESNTMCIYILCHLRFLKKFKKLYIKWVE